MGECCDGGEAVGLVMKDFRFVWEDERMSGEDVCLLWENVRFFWEDI